MRIIGLCKIRNESAIIKDTLDHWGDICTGGIYVYDDCSTDGTPKICLEHPKVKDVIYGEKFGYDPDRERAEYINRQKVLELAQKDAKETDWFVYFDADERVEGIDYTMFFQGEVKAIACQLFDFYITPEDVDKHYLERDYIGPEYRTIVFFFRNSKDLCFEYPDQRIVTLPVQGMTVISGYVRHYGKALSVEAWEKKCDYYIEQWPKYAAKWRDRKGKAVKEDYKSDFGNKLIHWHEVYEGKGFSLETMPYGKN